MDGKTKKVWYIKSSWSIERVALLRSIYFLYKALTLLGWLEAQPWKCAAIDKSMNQTALKVFSTQL